MFLSALAHVGSYGTAYVSSGFHTCIGCYGAAYVLWARTHVGCYRAAYALSACTHVGCYGAAYVSLGLRMLDATGLLLLVGLRACWMLRKCVHSLGGLAHMVDDKEVLMFFGLAHMLDVTELLMLFLRLAHILAATELLTFFGLTHVGCYGAASLSGLAHMLDATDFRILPPQSL